MTVDTFLANFGHLADAPNGVRKLRELILQLAVQGKLVPQDSRDEPAAKLLERIRKEKGAKDSRRGKACLAQGAASSAPTPDEIPYELPEGWEWVRLEGVGLISPANKVADDLDASFVPMALISEKYGEPIKSDIKQWSEIKKGFTHFAEGDVVLAKITPCFQNGKSAVMRGLKNGVGAGTTELHVFRPLAGTMSPEYVLAYLKSPSFINDGISKMTGSAGQKRVPREYFSQNPFPLPPLAEQHRIVAKVDQLMALCDELEARQRKQQEGRVRLNNAALDALLNAGDSADFAKHWQRIRTNFDLLYDHPDTIVKLRAAILQLAVQGKLVPRENPDLWREGVLGDIVDSSEAGWSPQCENRPCSGGEWGVLKVSAVSWGKFDPNENKALPSHLEARSRWSVKNGYFLISRANTAELVARSVVVVQDHPRLLMSDKIIRVNFKKNADPNYFNLVNNSPFSREYYARVAGGTSSSMKNVSRQQILALPVAIPPLVEQHRIVAKVEQLMALCDALEAKLNHARQQSEKLVEASVRQLLVA
jgi:type I restriction enzyme S subunit